MAPAYNGPDLGAWYAGIEETTAIVEVAWHMRREAVAAQGGRRRAAA